MTVSNEDLLVVPFILSALKYGTVRPVPVRNVSNFIGMTVKIKNEHNAMALGKLKQREHGHIFIRFMCFFATVSNVRHVPRKTRWNV